MVDFQDTYSLNTQMNTTPTLYDRLGGKDAIGALVYELYDRIGRDEELAPFFSNTSFDHLRTMQREFLTLALGGEGEYTGRPLSHVHHGMGIKPHHFQLFVDHLADVLKDHDIPETEMTEVIDRVNILADEITGAGGGLDG